MKKLQRYHGEYVPDMRNILGLTGRVIKVYIDGDLRVNFDGKTWTLNPSCVTNLSGELQIYKSYLSHQQLLFISLTIISTRYTCK